MPTSHRHQPAIFRTLLIVFLLCFGTELKAQSPEARPNAEPTSSDQTSELRKFTFKHAKADEAWKMIQKLRGSTNDNTPGIVVDDRSNSIFFKVDLVNDARRLEELFALLDTESPVSTDPAKGFSLSVPALGPIPLAFDFSDSIETLKQRYNELKHHAHQLAEKLKQSKSPSETQRTELQLAVRKSFDALQALQRAELVDLAGRMKSMQQSIDMRDKLVEKIVQKRVDDLVNPNVTWDAGQLSRPSLASQSEDSSNAAMLLPKSAAPSIASVPSVPGERPERGIRKRIQGRPLRKVPCTCQIFGRFAKCHAPVRYLVSVFRANGLVICLAQANGLGTR